MPQLQINQGPQDALLYDNTRSYFTNVGYVRTSNFQVEYRDVDSQNTAQVGSTVQYVIPKAADLLGPVDLQIELKAPTADGVSGTIAADKRAFAQWVDELGFAIIEKCTFSVGSNDIETITGEQMQIKNELMTSDEQRLGFDHVMKTGRRAFAGLPDAAPTSAERPGDNQSLPANYKKLVNKDFTRLISYTGYDDPACGTNGATPLKSGKRKLTIPLALFFTKHVSQYFPLAAVAGCNDVRIAIKFRALNELVQAYAVGATATMDVSQLWSGGNCIEKASLRCHYVHVTGPEATTLMNKEHVRLLKLWQHQHKTFDSVGEAFELDLSFLHPVTTLILTVRRVDDMGTDIVSTSANASQKGYFFYHGDGTNPNYDRCLNQDGSAATGSSEHTVKVSSIQLTLNGQERHPGLSKGIERDYLMSRLLPMLHSNSNTFDKQIAATYSVDNMGTAADLEDLQRYEIKGSKNIMVYPFSLNPEGSNPSGAVNFSKVSHAKLKIFTETSDTAGSELKSDASGGVKYRVDVYGLYYNWLQIKDGRALLSFA